MKFTENRKLAVIVLIAVILFSVIGQGCMSMKNRRGDIEEVFMQGTGGEIVSRCKENGALLGTAVVPYLSEGSAGEYCSGSVVNTLKDGGYFDAAASLETLSKALGEAKDPNSCIKAMNELTEAVEKAYSGICMLSLTDEQMKDIKLAYYDYKGGLDILSRDDSYNALVNAYNSDISAFPANLIAQLSGTEKLTVCGN